MDFHKMMNAASKNAQRAEREVDRIQNQVNDEKSERQKQLEAEKAARMEMQRRKAEKEKEIARKRQERQEEERRRNFTIPKRNDGPSSSSSNVSTSAVRALVERQKAEKAEKEKRMEAEKQRLMSLRMQANGGKATKKMGKQFGMDVIDLQTRFGGNNEHLEVLQKRKIKEEDDADIEADRYRSGVYKALAAKQKNESQLRNSVQGPHRVSTSKSNSLAGLCSRHERTRDTFSPPKDGKKSEKSRQPVVEKKKIQAAAPIDFQSLMAAASSISEGKKVNLEHLQTKPAKSVVSSSSQHQKSSSLSSSDRDRLREKERLREKQERARDAEKHRIKEKERERARKEAAAAHQKARSEKNGDSAHGASANGANGGVKKKETPAVRKPFQKGPTPPPLIPAAIPGKRYLPGDVRYKEAMGIAQKGVDVRRPQNSSSGNIASSSGFSGASSSSKDRISVVREAERQREREREKQRALKRAREERSARDAESHQSSKIRKTSSSFQSSSSATSSSKSSSEAKRSYEARRMAELREQQMREKERKKKKNGGSGGGSFWKGADDYTDEEDEDDDRYDDEYDSDMDDFIDDTDEGVDRGYRKELEDAMKLVNPKYDTEKWSRREKAINERDMVSDYRRIQSEENYSKRAGFMEDLQEASKGRSVKL